MRGPRDILRGEVGSLARAEAHARSLSAASARPVHSVDDKPQRASTPLDFEEFYKAYVPRVRGLIRRYVKDPAHVEELVQDTFLRVWRVRDNIDLARPMWPWVATLAKRIAIDAWRSARAPCDEYPTQDDTYVTVPSADSDPVEAFWAHERRDVVRRVLASLKPRYRRVLLLKDHEGWDYEELAALEGTTSGAMRTVLMRARCSFRKLYESAAQERGLSALIFGPFAPRLRRMTGRLSATWRQLQVPAANVGPGATAEIANGLLVLALLVMSTVPLAANSVDRTPPSSTPTMFASSKHASSLEATERHARASEVESSAAAPTERNRIGLNDITDPNHNVREPEDAHILSVSWSPRGDGVVFAAGRNRRCATSVCPAVLFRSDDAGGSWTKLIAKDFEGSSVVLPPAYGAGDERIFAMASTGVLQVSHDGGKSFGSAVLGAPQIGGAMAMSPGFNTTDPRIVFGSETSLLQYQDDTKTIVPAAYSTAPGSLEPAFATPDLLMVGGRVTDETGKLASAVYRCESTLCTSTRLSDQSTTPKVRLTRDFERSGRMVAFTDWSIFLSKDGGRSFSAGNAPAVKPAGLIDVAWAADGKSLYAAAWSSGRTADEGLYISRNGGATWLRVQSALFADGGRTIGVAGGRVIVGLEPGGLACSADDGRTWGRRC